MSSSSPSLSLFAIALALPALARGAQDQDLPFSPGSEKAVRTIRDACPDAVVREVRAPVDFGADSEDGSPLFWVLKLQRHGAQQELKVTPDGIVIVLPRTIDERDLPKSVADAMNKEAAGASVLSREQQETRATLRYVALTTPKVHYVVHVAKDSETARLDVSADGTVLHRYSLGRETEPKAAGDAGAREDAKVPPAAARAVAAVRAIVPSMVLAGVEEVGYLDGTGEIEVLNYEVEFWLDGTHREWNASPDGIVIEVPSQITLASLPATVRATLAQQAGWEVKKIVREETRAGLKFVALERPKRVYVAEIERDGKPVKLRFHADGGRFEPVDPRGSLGKK